MKKLFGISLSSQENKVRSRSKYGRMTNLLNNHTPMKKFSIKTQIQVYMH